MLLYVGEYVDLVDRAFLQLLILFESAHLDDLHCVLFVIVFVDRAVDFAVRPFADNLVERVVLNYSHHCLLIIFIIGPYVLTECSTKICGKKQNSTKNGVDLILSPISKGWGLIIFLIN